jgi:hypothetical protein
MWYFLTFYLGEIKMISTADSPVICSALPTSVISAPTPICGADVQSRSSCIDAFALFMHQSLGCKKPECRFSEITKPLLVMAETFRLEGHILLVEPEIVSNPVLLLVLAELGIPMKPKA